MATDTGRLLSDVTEQEWIDLTLANPKLAETIIKADPRVRLWDAVYGSKKTLKDLKRLRPDMTFAELVEEMGIEIAPDSNLGRARRHARAEIEDDITAIKRLRTELEKDKTTEAQTRFVADVRESATDLGFTVSEKDLDEIVTFMKDNEYGVKATKKAVEAFFEGRAPAEPNFESEHTFQFENEGSDYIKKLTESPPFTDTSQLTLQHAERTWQDMFGKSGGPGRAKRALAAR